MNTVTIVGRLTRPPELTTSNDGETKIATFRLAVPRPTSEDHPDFLPVKAFGRTAEVIMDHGSQGKRVAVAGSLSQSSWDTPDGSRRERLEVIARQIELLDSPRGAEATNDRANTAQQNNGLKPAPALQDEPF